MELVCRDETVIPAAPGVVYDVLTDLSTYECWNTSVEVEPLGPKSLAPGVKFRYSGRDQDGKVTMTWVIEVESLTPERRIDLHYVEGDLVGPVGWELEPVDAGTLTAYVYRGVQPTNPRAAASFERFGLRVHNLAMQATLDGLSRHVRGEQLGVAWRAEVAERIAQGVARL